MDTGTKPIIVATFQFIFVEIMFFFKKLNISKWPTHSSILIKAQMSKHEFFVSLLSSFHGLGSTLNSLFIVTYQTEIFNIVSKILT